MVGIRGWDGLGVYVSYDRLWVGMIGWVKGGVIGCVKRCLKSA